MYINEIDRLRHVDVPWKLYLVGYVILLLLLGAGVYVAQTSYNLTWRNVVAYTCAGVVVLTVCVVMLTYCGFVVEESEDVQTLCFLQNKIRDESKQQMNYQRMNMKLNASNWGRPENERDEVFLLRVNQMRGQANTLMHGAQICDPPDPNIMAELFNRLSTRMHEILFENAGLIKRLYLQINGVDEWKAAGGDCNKQMPIIREVFAMHLAIRLFGSKSVTNYDMITMLAGDNMMELIKKCDALVSDESFKEAVQRASGCNKADVDCAFTGEFKEPKEMMATLKALNTIYQALIEKFPKREYQRVMETGALDDPDVAETVSF